MGSTAEMILAAVQGPKPYWAPEAMSTLVDVNQGELGLLAAAKVLDEHALNRKVAIVEVARVRHRHNDHEAIYARMEPLP